MAGILGRSLTDEERRELERWQRSEHRVKFIRARVILLAESTPNAAVVARAIGVHVQTVRDLVRTFRANGLAGLKPRVRTGLPRRFGDSAVEVLIDILHERPEKYGLDDARWTLEAVAKVLAKQLGVQSVSIETVRRLLRRKRYSWQRAKEWIESPDPEYDRKKGGEAA
jgi:transposase